jgi:bifunctional UDP-N-acetylglucosamine pyrophosphorylase/glucosamine-1-phosphate N-acetyltransferase
MNEGVTILDPETTRIDADVQIGADTVIYPSVQIYGHTVIGEDVEIRSFNRMTNAKIGARSLLLESCIIDDSTLGEEVTLGPFARLRPGAFLSNRVKVGNFVEIKKSTLGAGSKSMHLAYVGDATIGKNVNIGAGVITCNYDGVNKHPTVIEDGAFVGTDSQLIAPVRIGKDAYIAAGSSITEDVPPGSLAIARGRQVNKEDWVKQRKKKG